MPGGLTKEGTEALDRTLARHVGHDGLPGLVALVARGDDVHVAAHGHKAFGDPEPIGRDAIFRIASISKPIAGIAAMLLIQDEAMALDDPIDRWLPEFAAPRVLRRLDSSLTTRSRRRDPSPSKTSCPSTSASARSWPLAPSRSSRPRANSA